MALAPNAPLIGQQPVIYRHRVNVWRATTTVNAATGEPSQAAPVKVAEGVSCHFFPKPQEDAPTLAGGQAEITRRTAELVRFTAAQDVQDNDLLEDVTPGFARRWVRVTGQHSRVMYPPWIGGGVNVFLTAPDSHPQDVT